MMMFSHPNALENLYKAQVKKYKTPKTNIGFIRHMYVAIYNHGKDIHKFDCFIYSLFVPSFLIRDAPIRHWPIIDWPIIGA